MVKVADISNYDYDQDVTNSDGWVPAFKAAGIEGVIIGSQWMNKARWQVEKCKAGGLPVVATYAEPNVATAISLAGVAGCSTVCIVIEPGGIQDVQLLRSGIADVRAAGLVPVLYGNRGDVLATADLPEFKSIPLWIASYFDDHHVINSVSWWPELWGHQYTSTEYIAGKNRDVSEVFEGEDMTIPDDLLLALYAGSEAKDDAGVLLPTADRLALAKYRMEQAASGQAQSVAEMAASAKANLAEHIANTAAGVGGPVPEHTHAGGKVIRP